MPQHEYVPRGWRVAETSSKAQPGQLRLESQSDEDNGPITFNFEAVRPRIFRTTVRSAFHPLPPHPSAQRPANAWGGSDPPLLSQSSNEVSHKLVCNDVVANIEWDHSPLITLAFKDSEDHILHSDLPYRSYSINGKGVSHYTKYDKSAMHVGLGEKAAPMDLSGRGFHLSATDSFGYDNYKTDPLYKVIPLLISATPQGCVAIFSTSHSRGYWSIDEEVDGMWGRYKVLRQDYGGLEEYLIVGRTLKEVVHSYAELVGFPGLVPRWAFGYIAGGMKYSMLDDPPANEALLDFADKLKEHDIPCSAFQMSSGYTVAETEPKTRNVFTWNYHRFPDPKGFIDAYHARGIRLLANIKPYVLANHPAYKQLAAAGAFFKDPRTKKTAVARLWSAGGGESGEGSHIDFTSKAGFSWWYEGVKSLKRLGIDVPWNDNNEFVIPSDDWECALDEPSIQDDVRRLNEEYPRLEKANSLGLWGRALHTELNGKSSHDALVASEPDRRPFVLTRSATAGTMRYVAASWSGDNVTSWSSFRGSTALALNAGMSLLQCYGHDTGGFEGPQPSPTLLLRWIQTACHTSRFAINCFKTSSADNKVGDVIEPWMYPEITDLVRRAIKRRYEILPYTYSLALKSHLTAEPPQRWVGWGYEEDPEVWSQLCRRGETQFWLGDCLVVGSPLEEKSDVAQLYLPKKNEDDPGYINLNEPYQYIEAGQWVFLVARQRGNIATIAKCGTALPVGKDTQTLSVGEKTNEARLPADEYRGVEIFPPPWDEARQQVLYSSTWLEDDGISAEPDIVEFKIKYRCLAVDEIEVHFEVQHETATFKPSWTELHVILPVNDDRKIVQPETGIELPRAEEQSSQRDAKPRKFYVLREW